MGERQAGALQVSRAMSFNHTVRAQKGGGDARADPMHPVRIRPLETQGTSTLQAGGSFTMNSGGFSFTTPVQLLVMPNAKCRQFTGVREDLHPWSL